MANDQYYEDSQLLDPIRRTSRRFLVAAAMLVSLVALALGAWIYQLNYGLGVTGLNRPVYWGVYITNFVFFIGVSHAGTLISAILRLTQAEWRRSITRAAEVITVLVLYFGAANIILDLGRPDRVLNVIKHGQLRSPLMWDVISISTYLTASTIYLFLPLIPDIAILRDRLGKRTWLYRWLALGWHGTQRQKRILNIGIAFMAVLVIPIAVSVHTVVSWVFGMTIQPMWHSSIFGPYFVIGAIFSGIASIIIAMAIIRKVYHLEEYLKPIHFNNLGILLLVMALAWLYFTFAEHLTAFYGSEPAEMTVFYTKIAGRYAFHFWAMVLFNIVIPFTLLCNRKTRTITGTLIASISVNIGMWLERFTIVVPTLINPRLPYPRGAYHATLVEVAITVGAFAGFILLYMVFTKLFPIVSIWEVQEGREHALKEAEKRIKTYLPGVAPEPKDAWPGRLKTKPN